MCLASETSNPFDYVNSINAGNDIITRADDPIASEQAYQPHLTNRALSYHVDCVLYTNDMNMRWELDKKLQYLYYLYTIRPKRRYGSKWHKPTVKNNVKLIQEVFPCNEERAKAVLSLLSKDELKQIQDMASMSDNNKNEPSTKNGRSKSSKR